MSHDRTERGSATVWLAGLVALVGLVTAVGVLQGAALVARHRAETAADLAALAGAVAVSSGDSEPCAEASRYAEANGARVTRCVVAGEDVEVVVERAVRLGRLGVRTATARARAGPADRDVNGGVATGIRRHPSG